MNAHVLGLYSETLEKFRGSLDGAIRTLVNNLIERNLDSGTVSAKIKVSVNYSISGDARPATKIKIEPDIGMKIGASGKLKCQEQKDIYLKYDDEGMPIIGDRQISIDEYINNRMRDGA